MLHFTPLIIPLSISAIISLSIALYAWKNRITTIAEKILNVSETEMIGKALTRIILYSVELDKSFSPLNIDGKNFNLTSQALSNREGNLTRRSHFTKPMRRR